MAQNPVGFVKDSFLTTSFLVHLTFVSIPRTIEAFQHPLTQGKSLKFTKSFAEKDEIGLLLRKLDVGPVSQNGKKIMLFQSMALEKKTLF